MFLKIEDFLSGHQDDKDFPSLLFQFIDRKNLEKLEPLLESTSYSPPKNNRYDLIIRFCFIHKIFKTEDINNLLEDYNYRLFHY